MKRNQLKMMLIAIISAVTLCTSANADFSKSKNYPDGLFTDVPASEWYYGSVKDAYEFGIMNGDSATTFSPEGTLTVAEGITVSARIHATLTGGTISPSDGEWYMQYVNYAIANGFMEADTFESYDRSIKRYEIAELLSDVCGNLPEINAVDGVYDVPSEKILKLYKTGIVMGNDEYGTFNGNANLKRSEISAMAVRIADSAKRVTKTLSDKPAVTHGDAYPIIENIRGYGPNSTVNGWNYDNRFDFFNETGAGTMMKLNDTKVSAYQRLIRDFKPESEGLLRFELNGSVNSADNGAYLVFMDEKENELLKLTVKGGYWYIQNTYTGVEAGACNIEMYIDLDKGVAKTVINNTECPDVMFNKGTFTRLVAGTTKEGTGNLHIFHTKLTKDYAVLDHFLTGDKGVGNKPALWYVNGDFRLQKNLGMLEPDLYSVKAETKSGDTSVAVRNFEPVSGLFTFETSVLFPEKVNGAKISILSEGKEVLSFETKLDSMYMGGLMLNDYMENVWQTLLIDGDTKTGKATVRVNGKNKGEFDFTANSIDGVKITFAPDKDAVMWFDDVAVYNRHEYDDYPSYPAVAESTDYNVGINVCWLWRDQQSGEGWDAVSPFPEFDTYLGFYDEGLRETADWEIKLMAEHGIDFLHVCWYAPYGNTTEPIKQMRHSHNALHDGYFNAKYSDLVDFCIMWENNSTDVKSLDDFKEYIWKYWVEYYFKDDRYLRLDNKALITVWSATNFASAFGGNAGALEAISFMNEDIKKYGYDGVLIITNAGGAENTLGKYTWLSDMGLDGTYIYATSELDGEKQWNINKDNMSYAENYAMFHMPTIGVGFNDIGRNQKRSGIISEEDHLIVCKRTKEALDAKKTGTFLDNTLMISTWNEWSEGHYVMPSTSNGFSYLENIRKTFTTDTSDHASVDAPLTEAQLARINRTYPENHSPIRWFKYEKSDMPKDYGENHPGVIVNGTELKFNFLPVKTEDGDLEVTAEDRNMGFYSMMRLYHEWNRFDGNGVLTLLTKDEKTVKFTVGESMVLVDGKAIDAGFTFKLRDGIPVFHIKKLCDILGYPYTVKGEKVLVQAATDHEYKVLSSRVDYQWEFDLEGEVDGWTPQGIQNFRVGDDGYLSGKSTSGDPAVRKTVSFYSDDFSHVRIGVVYKEGLYDGFKPQLYYTTKSSAAYSADKCLYGQYVVTEGMKDGDIMEAVFEIPENAGLEITAIRFDMFARPEEFKIDYIRITMEKEKAPEPVYVELADENCWYFDNDGDREGWTVSTEAGVAGGYLTATPANPDPYMIHDVSFKYNDYHVMIVGVKNTGSLRNKSGYLYFTTDKDGGWNGDKMISSKYKVPSGTEVGETVEIVFDLSSNNKFVGNITKVRFDPYNDLPTYEIDYIKFCRIEGKESFVHEETAELEEEKPEEVIPDRDVMVHKGNYTVPDKSFTWEFDENGEKGGWSTGLTINVENGVMKADVNKNADPNIQLNTRFSADDFDVLVVGMKYTPHLKGRTGYLYFLTDTDGKLGEDKRIDSSYRCPKGVINGDTVEIIFDLNSHEKFDGNIKYIRFDPYNDLPGFEIDYIRLAKLGEEQETAPKDYVTHQGSYTEPADGNRWDFELAGFDDSWRSSLNVDVDGGYLNLAGGSADPYVLRNVSFDADKYEIIVVGVKYEEHMKNKTGYLYFTTSESTSMGQDKCISAKYIIPEDVKVGDTVEIIFQVNYHELYKGKITLIRFDPWNDLQASHIDYIKCCTDYNAPL